MSFLESGRKLKMLENTSPEVSTGEGHKYKTPLDNVVEPVERRMSDLSDWAPNVASLVDIQEKLGQHFKMHKKTEEIEMAVLEAKIATSKSTDVDVFKAGSFAVLSITTRTSEPSSVEVFIVAPTQKGTYPVLLLCHGWLITNTWYTDLLTHIATHGYIVVAPQFYGLFNIISVTKEVTKAAQVAEWLSSGLPLVLPGKVSADMDNLALSGHSRGGKIAFALALGRYNKESRTRKASIRDDPTPPKFKALIGIDPVAGSSPSNRDPPKILEYIPRCFQQSIPVAVIGTGYGNQSQGLVPPFAPDGVNHSEFFNESKPPMCYFLAKDYGHCDMMDDSVISFTSYFCKSGKGSKDLMRKSVGGIVVAFLKAYLGEHDYDLNAIVKDPSLAPINLDPVIYVKE